MSISRRISKLRFSAFGRVQFSTKPEYITFPREVEGNIYADNWSLVVDGVTPTGNAYRNARSHLLTSRLGVKSDAKRIDLQKPLLDGTFVVKEAGDGLSHDEFADAQAVQQGLLTDAADLFVEDAGVVALSGVRVGVRFTSQNPAVALIARSLLVRFVDCSCICLFFVIIFTHSMYFLTLLLNMWV